MCSGSEIAGVAVDWMRMCCCRLDDGKSFFSYLFFFSTNTRLFHHANVSEISYTTAIAVYACFFLLLYKPWCLKKFINVINVFPTHKKKK